MPKRSRSGVVSRPARVVAPTSVNGGRSSVTTRAPGALADRDRQLAVLHRRVERLLERAVQAVDLVDEEDGCAARARSATRRCRPCARAPGRRSARTATSSSAARICASDVLPRPGGPGEQDVVERLAARARRPASETASCSRSAVLADELLEPARPQRAVELVLAGQRRRRLDARGSSGHPPCAPPAARSASSSSALSPVGVAAAARRPRRRRSRARAGRRARGVAGRRRGVDARSRGSPAPSGRPSRAARRRSARPCACRCPGRPAGARRRRPRAPRRARAAARRRARRARPSARRPGRRAAAGRGRAPPRSRSRRARARRRARRGGCAARRCRPTAGTWRSVSAETARR